MVCYSRWYDLIVVLKWFVVILKYSLVSLLLVISFSLTSRKYSLTRDVQTDAFLLEIIEFSQNTVI